MLDAKTIRSRLALIRHLYRHGVEQADQPEPLRAFSVLTFHDAVELFLGLALDHSGVVVPGKQDVKFLDYWELLSKATPPVQLLGKTQMNKLNLARVALKHHGQLPSTSTVEEVRGSVTSFLKDGCTEVFGIDFDAISMVDLVVYAPVREPLLCAEQLIAAGEFKLAAAELALAFARLLREYDVAGNMVPWTLESRGIITGINRTTAKTLTNLADAVRVLALGLDYRRYRRFRKFTPAAVRTIDGELSVSTMLEEPTREQCEDCLDFVIDSALRVHE